MSEYEPIRTNPQPFQTITDEQLEQMPVILTARQYQALDEALELVEMQGRDPDDPDSVDFSDQPLLEQIYIRLAIAALSPWDNPVNKPILSRIGMCFGKIQTQEATRCTKSRQ